MYPDENFEYDDIIRYRRKINDEKGEIGEFCSDTIMENRKCYSFRTDDSYFVITKIADAQDEPVTIMYINIQPFLKYTFTINIIVFILYLGISAIMGIMGLKLGSIIDKTRDNEKKFFQNSSHELKTPLMSIQGYAEGIRMEVNDPFDAASVIIKESERMTKLVEELLYISKIDSCQLSMDLQKTDIHEVIYDCIRQVEPLTEKNGRRIILHLEEEPLYVKCDEDQMMRAISNIIINAVYHCKTFVSVFCKGEGEYIEIMIHNNGTNIAEDAVSHIFDRFYTRHEGGSGIGLSIAKEVIELHKGKISVKNESEGITFSIILPKYRN